MLKIITIYYHFLSIKYKQSKFSVKESLGLFDGSNV